MTAQRRLFLFSASYKAHLELWRVHRTRGESAHTTCSTNYKINTRSRCCTTAVNNTNTTTNNNKPCQEDKWTLHTHLQACNTVRPVSCGQPAGFSAQISAVHPPEVVGCLENRKLTKAPESQCASIPTVVVKNTTNLVVPTLEELPPLGGKITAKFTISSFTLWQTVRLRQVRHRSRPEVQMNWLPCC